MSNAATSTAHLFKATLPTEPNANVLFKGTQEEFLFHAQQQSNWIFANNVHTKWTEAQVRLVFENVAPIQSLILGIDKKSKSFCGFCFVQFYQRKDADLAVQYLNQASYGTCTLTVTHDAGFEEGRQYGKRAYKPRSAPQARGDQQQRYRPYERRGGSRRGRGHSRRYESRNDDRQEQQQQDKQQDRSTSSYRDSSGSEHEDAPPTME